MLRWGKDLREATGPGWVLVGNAGHFKDPSRELPRFRHGLEESYLEYVRRCDPVAHALAGARRVGKFFGMLRWEGFFREATGPGWVLVGDAGHFKDPSPGQGIQDAFRQVESLEPAILRRPVGPGVGGTPSRISGISCGLRLTGMMSVPLAGRILAPAASDDR